MKGFMQLYESVRGVVEHDKKTLFVKEFLNSGLARNKDLLMQGESLAYAEMLVDELKGLKFILEKLNISLDTEVMLNDILAFFSDEENKIAYQRFGIVVNLTQRDQTMTTDNIRMNLRKLKAHLAQLKDDNSFAAELYDQIKNVPDFV